MAMRCAASERLPSSHHFQFSSLCSAGYRGKGTSDNRKDYTPAVKLSLHEFIPFHVGFIVSLNAVNFMVVTMKYTSNKCYGKFV